MGALSIRLPESLHARIRILAKQEGVSINQFIMLATAEKALLLEVDGARTDYLAARAARATGSGSDPRQVFLDYVADAPDIAPEPHDRLEKG